VVSTAVEDSVPDVAAARKRDLPIIHRSELLAYFVHSHRTIAVTGTSGKSTVVAMIFDILRGAAKTIEAGAVVRDAILGRGVSIGAGERVQGAAIVQIEGERVSVAIPS
jgi:UDP-N-acetylmuramate--alanine ligase